MNELDRRLLAGRIKDLREALGESPEQFAERLGVTVDHIRWYEVAIRRPGFDPTKKLFEAAREMKEPALAEYFEKRMNGLKEWMSDRTNL